MTAQEQPVVISFKAKIENANPASPSGACFDSPHLPFPFLRLLPGSVPPLPTLLPAGLDVMDDKKTTAP